MTVLAAYAVPHPPLIVAGVGRGQEQAIADTIEAYHEVADRIMAHDPDVIVLASPHAPLYRDGFFVSSAAESEGSMASFGAPDEALEMWNDCEFQQMLADRLREEGVPVAGSGEPVETLDHAAFVPLYFLSEYLPQTRLVRLGLSGMDDDAHLAVGREVAKVARDLGRRVVFVASGDLSHKLKSDGPYGFAEEGPVFDQKVMEIMAAGDLSSLFELDPLLCYAAAECGLRSFEIMAGALDGLEFESELLSYEGPFGVGYGVVAFEVQPEGAPVAPDTSIGAAADKTIPERSGAEAYDAARDAFPEGLRSAAKECACAAIAADPADFADPDAADSDATSPTNPTRSDSANPGCVQPADPASADPFDDAVDPVADAVRAAEEAVAEAPFVDPLVALARAAVETYVVTGTILPRPTDLPEDLLTTRAGAFVSLHEGDALRGCIGTIEAMQDCLADEIIANGVSAASRDPRFPPVRPHELDFLSYSVDVLAPAEPIASIDELDPARYGVIVTKGWNRGLLLPDLEGVDTAEQQVSIACAKAGLRPDEPGIALERFEVVRHSLGGEARASL